MNRIERDRHEDFWWADPALHASLLEDPAAAIRSLGLNVPKDAPLSSLIETAKIFSMIWQDGVIIAKRDFSLSADDEGLLFGRGVWESTRTFDSKPWLWDFHLERLLHTAKLLNIRVDSSRLPNQTMVSRFVRRLTGMEVVIRLNVSAGGSGKPGTIWMTASLPPEPMEEVRLQTVRNPIPKGQPYLIWKTFQYATRLQIGRSAAIGFDSTLLVNDQDQLLEAAHANIFVRTRDGWATPISDGGLLPGTVRRELLAASPIPIQERAVQRGELAEATEVFVTNSNVGIVPVTKVDGQLFPVGDETRKLAHWLRERSAVQERALQAVETA